MREFQRSFGMVAAINGHLLMTATGATVAWFSWPSAPEYWGFAFISIAFAGAGFASLVNALRKMGVLYMRDKTLAAYQAKTKAQKNADLASTDTLIKAGVVDG
ncbi:MAG: hypothetical protein AAFY42_13000 [Pseudomonadota bacterium]